MTPIKRYKRLEPREKVLKRLGWHRDRGSGSDGDEWQEWVAWYGGKIRQAIRAQAVAAYDLKVQTNPGIVRFHLVSHGKNAVATLNRFKIGDQVIIGHASKATDRDAIPVPDPSCEWHAGTVAGLGISDCDASVIYLDAATATRCYDLPLTGVIASRETIQARLAADRLGIMHKLRDDPLARSTHARIIDALETPVPGTRLACCEIADKMSLSDCMVAIECRDPRTIPRIAATMAGCLACHDKRVAIVASDGGVARDAAAHLASNHWLRARGTGLNYTITSAGWRSVAEDMTSEQIKAGGPGRELYEAIGGSLAERRDTATLAGRATGFSAVSDMEVLSYDDVVALASPGHAARIDVAVLACKPGTTTVIDAVGAALAARQLILVGTGMVFTAPRQETPSWVPPRIDRGTMVAPKPAKKSRAMEPSVPWLTFHAWYPVVLVHELDAGEIATLRVLARAASPLAQHEIGVAARVPGQQWVAASLASLAKRGLAARLGTTWSITTPSRAAACLDQLVMVDIYAGIWIADSTRYMGGARIEPAPFLPSLETPGLVAHDSPLLQRERFVPVKLRWEFTAHGLRLRANDTFFKGDPGNHDRVFDALLGMNALPRGVLNVLAAPTGTPLLDIGKLDTLHLSDGEMLPPDAWRASIEALIADAKVPGMTGVIDVNGFLAQHGNVKEWPTTTTEPSEVAHAEIPPATIAVMHGSEPIMIIDGDHVTLAIPIDDVPYPALASPRACIIACKARVRNLPRDIDVIAYVIRRGKKGKPPALMQHVKTAVGTYFDRAFDAYMRQHVLAAPVDQVAWDTAMAAAGRAVHAIAAITGDASLPGRARRVARDAAIDCSANLSPKITLSGAETSDAGGALIGLDALGPPIYYPPVTKQGLLARLRQRMKHG